MIKHVELYCPKCSKKTKQVVLVDVYGTQCNVCDTRISSLDRSHTESNTYITPDGDVAVVVKNNKQQAVFMVDTAYATTYYNYDKASGFGGIQEVPK